MQLGLVGLGKMGLNMAKRLIRHGHAVVGTAREEASRRELVAAGGTGAADLRELVGELAAPRVVWVMVPAGGPTEQVLGDLAAILAPGDVVVDGGNSN